MGRPESVDGARRRVRDCLCRVAQRAVDAGAEPGVTRAYLAANTLFYGFLFVGILFFWSWANYRNPGFTAVGPDAAPVVWGIVDALLPLLCGAMGVSLIRARAP